MVMHMFQSQTRRLLPRNEVDGAPVAMFAVSFNRRRDACFLATLLEAEIADIQRGFNRRRDACFLATPA